MRKLQPIAQRTFVAITNNSAKVTSKSEVIAEKALEQSFLFGFEM